MAVQFYTIPAHKNITITSATSTATGYDKQSVVDGNLDNVWKPTSTGSPPVVSSQNIFIDLGSAQTIDGKGIWLSNYDTNFSSMPIYLYGSSNGSDWTYYPPSLYPTNGEPLSYSESTTSVSLQYWYFKMGTPVPAVPQVGQIFLLRKREVSTAANYPFGNAVEYQNNEGTGGGRKYVNPEYTTAIQRLNRNYVFPLTANKTALENAFNDSGGGVRMLILKEPTEDAKLVRFSDDTLNISTKDYEYYEAGIKFETIPYIPAGETY